MDIRGRRLKVRLGSLELSADVPDGVDLVDFEIELSHELWRTIDNRERREKAMARLTAGNAPAAPQPVDALLERTREWHADAFQAMLEKKRRP